jgi:tyrosinase
MLHSNIDRLWAKWQWVKHRTDFNDANAYQAPPNNRIGHHLNDSMWPWNGDTHAPRPPTAPGGHFPPSSTTPVPGQQPLVKDMLDYLAVNRGDALGFGYDDVPFELPAAAVASANTASTTVAG